MDHNTFLAILITLCFVVFFVIVLMIAVWWEPLMTHMWNRRRAVGDDPRTRPRRTQAVARS